MTRTRLIATLSLVALLSVAGCAGLAPESGDGEPTAEELQDRALERMGDVETYSVETNTTVEVDEATVRTQLDGVVNERTRRAEFETTTRIESSQGTDERVVEMYVDNRTVYVSPEGEDRWQTIDVDDLAAYGGTNPWEADQVERQRILLEDADVEAVGNETVRGRSTTVIEADPTDESLDEFVEATLPQRAGFGGAEIRSAELTQWVTDDGYVLRTEAEMVVVAGGETSNVTVRADFDEFDEPTDIEIPDEATDGQRA